MNPSNYPAGRAENHAPQERQMGNDGVSYRVGAIGQDVASSAEQTFNAEYGIHVVGEPASSGKTDGTAVPEDSDGEAYYMNDGGFEEID